MMTAYSTLDRTSSYLILSLTDLRINARLFGHDAMSQLEADLLDIADEARHAGCRLGVNKLVISWLGRLHVASSSGFWASAGLRGGRRDGCSVVHLVDQCSEVPV